MTTLGPKTSAILTKKYVNKGLIGEGITADKLQETYDKIDKINSNIVKNLNKRENIIKKHPELVLGNFESKTKDNISFYFIFLFLIIGILSTISYFTYYKKTNSDIAIRNLLVAVMSISYVVFLNYIALLYNMSRLLYLLLLILIITISIFIVSKKKDKTVDILSTIITILSFIPVFVSFYYFIKELIYKEDINKKKIEEETKRIIEAKALLEIAEKKGIKKGKEEGKTEYEIELLRKKYLPKKNEKNEENEKNED